MKPYESTNCFTAQPLWSQPSLRFVSMSANLNSAMEPRLALDRWIRYTQSELQSLRVDAIQQKEEEKSIHRIQQAQLVSIQSQVRDLSRQLAEVTEAITGLFNHVEHLRGTLDSTVNDFNHHFDSVHSNLMPPTQLAYSQGTSQRG